ncbi:MAG TPA: hypothetical protein VFJ70_02585 [Burkholderiales bacterium]|nr:hypothetical protein [Burkholderiales bacterium]
MRYIPFCLVVLAGCAVTPEKMRSMPIAEVCYTGMVEPDKQQMAADEVRRRNEDCAKHKAEIDQIRDQEMRAGGDIGGVPTTGRQSGGGMGGMGRGY